LLGSLDQAFQYIQEFSGFVTPGITVIFLLGLFWPRATEAGALSRAVASVLLSFLFWFPAKWGGIECTQRGAVHQPHGHRVPGLAGAGGDRLAGPAGTAGCNLITMQGVSFRTTAGFNIAAIVIILILIALYATWW
jgi:SSS family solute:Na+ symporter